MDISSKMLSDSIGNKYQFLLEQKKAEEAKLNQSSEAMRLEAERKAEADRLEAQRRFEADQRKAEVDRLEAERLRQQQV